MTFVHPLLLAGLLAVGIPVLLHLLMRQKPKHLLFPAVRFLMQRQRTNQRKLHLRHLLLLALRMLLLACICLALARPKIFSDRLNLVSGDRPIAAVLVFDTSPSMEYKSGGKSRLDEAKRRGLELLAELPEGSKVAVLDTAEPADDWQVLSLARERISNLRIRHANYAVTHQLAQAYGLFAKLQEHQEDPNEALVPFLYVFSDRTQAAWDAHQVDHLKRLRDRITAPAVHAVLVDVGIDKPEDLAIAQVEMARQIVPVEHRAEIRVTVRATGRDYDTELLCRIDGQEMGRKPVKLQAGQSQVLTFEQRRPAGGLHQVEVRLRATDAALTFNDVGYATFEVRGHRKALTITDEPNDAEIWKLTLGLEDAYDVEVKTPHDMRDLGLKELSAYPAICLLNVAQPSPELWEKLDRYVQAGGGLAVIPGGETMEEGDNLKAYNEDKKAQALLPGKFVRVIRLANKQRAIWNVSNFQHPVMAPFKQWGQRDDVDFEAPGLEPAANRYWEVQPTEALTIVPYMGEGQHPALLERKFDRVKSKIRGRVLMFTVPLDDRHLGRSDKRSRWHDYVTSSFYVVLAHQTIDYLAGSMEDGNFNFQCGQMVPVPVPSGKAEASFTLQHPSLSAAESIVRRSDSESELHLTRAVEPGNYVVANEEGVPIAGFSLNVAPEESVLARVPPEQIEELLGPGTVLPLDFKTNLHEALLQHWSQPVELFPWLMVLLLLLLAAENLLANKFYRREEAQL